ncbi:MAG TPA: Gfo/Idh/MocA family oxidoreductase [Streptosporangiaceae bacterium]|nr:Gfo/Idh/MocA family oxidoreductase [Streptosporangiaceae bacterium]
MEALRFGLVGTGYWARVAHAPALGSTEGVEFSAVWGRNYVAAAALASGYDAVAHRDFDEFLSGVDAVAFSVPPDVQSGLAVRAARAGKHLLLEKPIAVTVAQADALVEAVEQSGVASAVFFTLLYEDDVRGWLAEVGSTGDWAGASGVWLGSALMADSPFHTPWRVAKGGLWDLGPHLVALLWNVLGPVESVTAAAGAGDVTHLVLHHRGGRSSVVTVGMDVPEPAGFLELLLFGASGRSTMPRDGSDPVPPLRTALTELAANTRSGQVTHPCDVRFGRDVVRVLAQAAGQLLDV